MKLFDSFTSKKHDFMVKEKDMIEVMNMIQLTLNTGCRNSSMNIGRCDWGYDSNVWFIHVDLTDDQWNVLLNECKDKKYQLIVKDNPNEMYFTKIES